MRNQKKFTNGTIILEKALSAFLHATGINISIDNKRLKSSGPADYLVKISPEVGALMFCKVEVKSNLHSAALVADRNKFHDSEAPCILVTSYVSPGVAESLKKLKIQFIDTTGNAYVELPGIYVYINKYTKSSCQIKEKPISLFQPTGLKVIFICLAEAVNNPSNAYTSIAGNLKKLAETSGVSLGSASNVRGELIAHGYLIEKLKGKFELQNRNKLLENWVKAYSERLRPKLLIGRFQSSDPQWWKTTELDSKAFLWGGEVAAAKLTKYLSPEIITVYAGRNPNRLINNMGMRPDQKGTVEIRNIFWNSENYRQNDCVHPLLIYADLLSCDDSRNIETAELIYKSYLSDAINSN